MENQKKCRKDRRDGRYVGNLDSFHVFLPYIFRQRIGCEAYISEQIDLTNLLAYLEQKNAGRKGPKYTMFQVIAAAFVKTLALRPSLNRFIAGRRFYQRDVISLAFIAKKQFNDRGEEGLLFLPFDRSSKLDDIHHRITGEVHESRTGKVDNSINAIDKLAKLPRFLISAIMGILRILDFYGKVPYGLIKEDPNYASIFMSNLGSIELNVGYHHLNDWGTNSIFVIIGKKHLAQFIDENGEISVRPALNLGITLDERIADGYYYSRSIKLLKYLLQNPQLLELPAEEEVDYDA